VRLDGTLVDGRYRLVSLYAVGGEGVVYECRDDRDAWAAPLVAKIPLLPFHRHADLSSNFLRRRREQLREEARNLETSGSSFMPRSFGLFDFRNPLLDIARGGEFAELEPVLIMERLPGFDLDLWLARVHRSTVPVQLLRRNLDRVVVVLLQALVELEDRGFFYADLRPGNLRMMGRPERRIRLLDAGSLVERGDESGRFPHVPGYLPPDLFRLRQTTGAEIYPTPATQVVMAGRTLYEVATGRVPLPGIDVDRALLKESNVSEPVADVIDGLLTGSFNDVRPALRYLTRRAVKRVANANLPDHAQPKAPAPPALSPPAPAPRAAPPAGGRSAARPPAPASPSPVPPAPAAPATRTAPAAPRTQHIPVATPPRRPTTQEFLPPPRPRSWWRRLLGRH
jgi:hypothetical protein